MTGGGPPRRGDPDGKDNGRGAGVEDLLVRALLRLYPRHFRRRWGGEMRTAFRDQARDRIETSGKRAWPGLLARTAWGMVRGALAEWRVHWTGGGEMEGDGSRRAGGGDRGRGRGTARGLMGMELRQARRRLVRAPVFTVVAVLTVGAGVGAFASVWAVVESVLLEPMPFDEPDELAWVWRDYTWFDLDRGWLGGPDVAWMAGRDDAFEAVSAVRWARMNLTGPSGLEPREARTLLTSSGFFELLGVEPFRGRGFLPEEDQPGAPAVAVLTWSLWRDAFGADPNALGRAIYLDGVAHRVVGILPEDFDFVMPRSLGSPEGADLYVPLQLDLASQDPGGGFLAGLVRRRSDAPAGQIEAALAAVADRVDDAWEGRELRLWAAPMREDLVAGVRDPLLAVLTAAGFLLLTLGANLATLLLARAGTRERETATRRALGAGRGDVAASVLVEIALLVAAGAALGVVAASRGSGLLARLARDTLPRTSEIALDGSGIALAVGAAALLGAMAAVGPLARAVGGDPLRSLREAGTRGGESRRRIRGRNALVVVQVALSLVLLVGAGLLGRSLAGLLATDPGFDPAGTLTLRISLDPGRYPDSLAVVGFVAEARERLAAVPGVEAVGVSEALPLATGTNQTGIRFPGAPGNTGDADADRPLADQVEVGPGFFRAAGMRLLEGRGFTPADAGDPRLVAVIDDVLARRFFPGGSALGARLWTGGDTATVVGVVDQARLYDVHRDDRGQVYYPAWMDPDGELYVALRTGGDPGALAAGARNALRSLDPSVPVGEVRTLSAVVRDSLAEERLNLTLVAAFALASLLLAALGIYGVVANAVVRRRGEIGLRMAVGAAGGQVVRTVVGDGLRLVAAGIVLGVPAAWGASRLVSALLFGVRPFDPWTYGSVAALLGGVALAAAWLPARRATRIDPSEALRSL